MKLAIITLSTLLSLSSALPTEAENPLQIRQEPEPQCFPDGANCRICVPFGENGTACVNRSDVCCSKRCTRVPSRGVSRLHERQSCSENGADV